MIDLNKVQLIWRSTSDIEVKTIESTGTSVVNFTVATNRRFKNKEGNLVEEAEYHRCVAYGNAADILGKYANKGKRMYVEGRLRTRKREDSEGSTRYSTEIIVENFIFLDSRGPSSDGDSKWGDKEAAPADTPEEDLPF